MEKYVCNKGHEFKATEMPSVCPKCGSLKIEPKREVSNKRRLKFLLALVLILSLLGAGLYLFLAFSKDSYEGIIDCRIEDDGYVEISVLINPLSDNPIKIDDSDILNDLKLKLSNADNEMLDYELKSENKIYPCFKNGRLTVSGEILINNQTYKLSDTIIGFSLQKISDKAICGNKKSKTNSICQTKLKVQNAEFKDCNLIITHNCKKGNVWISINGKEGDFQKKEKWSLKGRKQYTFDIWAYIDEDNKLEYPMNGIVKEIPECQKLSNQNNNPSNEGNKNLCEFKQNRIDDIVDNCLSHYSKVMNLKSSYYFNDIKERISCKYIFEGREVKISALKGKLRNNLKNNGKSLSASSKCSDSNTIKILIK